MNRELVLPPGFGDYAWEFEAKGYLDAAVRIDGSLISVSFYDPVRLQQDIAADIQAGRIFTVKRLLVIEQVTIENMQWAVAEAPLDFFG
ncbi:hypothetical protein ACJJV6_17185 [Arthrobacter nitrophenolicus]|uniref:Uncharacterized protein n=2 Tax=Arthrobacter nitrophenolicus TaxID=683150 RepID=A0ACC6TIQ7_9MICC|nr:hypothetical protein [Arthrobacter nitrophenolicus]ELT44043.1 hypothetical protein G205_14413 [Arthrobacter nitrophenolicus]